MAIVYQHIRKDNGKIFYVGIGKTKSRAFSKESRNIHWHNIVNKVGYNIEILHENISWEDACEKEIELIKKYGRLDLKEGTLVNMTNGGEGTIGVVVTEETRKKQSTAHSGQNNPMFGRKGINNPNFGKIAHNKGSKISEITKIKISNSIKEQNHPMYGKHHTDDTRKKQSMSMIGRCKTEQQKQKMRKPKIKEVCPHCLKTVAKNNRYHFNNCKRNK